MEWVIKNNMIIRQKKKKNIKRIQSNQHLLTVTHLVILTIPILRSIPKIQYLCQHLLQRPCVKQNDEFRVVSNYTYTQCRKNILFTHMIVHPKKMKQQIIKNQQAMKVKRKVRNKESPRYKYIYKYI